jgi:hypothetical protein
MNFSDDLSKAEEAENTQQNIGHPTKVQQKQLFSNFFLVKVSPYQHGSDDYRCPDPEMLRPPTKNKGAYDHIQQSETEGASGHAHLLDFITLLLNRFESFHATYRQICVDFILHHCNN